MELTSRWPNQTPTSKNGGKVYPIKVDIKKRNNIIYYSFNNGTETQLIAVPPDSLTVTFSPNVTLGASLDSSGNPFRYFSGIVSNVSIELLDN